MEIVYKNGSGNMTIKEQIIKDTFLYNGAQYISQALGFFSATAMRRFLGPYFMGIWSLLRVVVDYASFSNLGVEVAASYKIPFYKGKGDKIRQADITNAAFGFILVMSVIAGIFLIGAAFLMRSRFSYDVSLGIAIIGMYLILQRLYSYYLVVLRSNSNFSVISRSVIFDAAGNLILYLLLLRHLQLYGLYIVVILMALLNTLYMHFLARYKITYVFNPKVIYSLIKTGLILLLVGVLNTVLRSIDRIMIAKMIGITSVGYYSIALMAKNYLGSASNNFSIVAVPRLMESYGKEQNAAQVEKFLTVAIEAVSFLLPCLLGFTFLITPLFVKSLLPQFIPGILAAQILLLDIFFFSCSMHAEQFLIALGKQMRLVPIYICAILLNIAVSYILIKKGFGISAVAIGSSVSSFVGFVLTLSYAMSHLTTVKKIAIFLARIIFPVSYSAAVVIGCTYFLNMPNAILEFCIRLIILIITSIPLFVYIDRKTHVLRILLGLSKRSGKTV